ncbi:MAG TPA: hypothetical protein VF451_07510 [Acidobacteriota bacterium]
MTKISSLKWGLGSGLAALGILFLASCSGSGSAVNPPPTLDFNSSIVLGHFHTITINKSDIDNPPAAGLALTTSVTSAHSHRFTMTPDELLSVAAGSAVTVITDFGNGGDGVHTHSFSIMK